MRYGWRGAVPTCGNRITVEPHRGHDRRPVEAERRGGTGSRDAVKGMSQTEHIAVVEIAATDPDHSSLYRSHTSPTLTPNYTNLKHFFELWERIQKIRLVHFRPS